MTETTSGTDRELLRHALATLAYRGGKVLRDPPADFGDFRIGPTSRSPVDRFFESLTAFDDYLASYRELGFPVTRLLQGPVADSLTHVGQIAMLRRLADSPVKGENYAKADITTGVVGERQPPAAWESD